MLNVKRKLKERVGLADRQREKVEEKLHTQQRVGEEQRLRTAKMRAESATNSSKAEVELFRRNHAARTIQREFRAYRDRQQVWNPRRASVPDVDDDDVLESPSSQRQSFSNSTTLTGRRRRSSPDARPTTSGMNDVYDVIGAASIGHLHRADRLRQLKQQTGGRNKSMSPLNGHVDDDVNMLSDDCVPIHTISCMQ